MNVVYIVSKEPLTPQPMISQIEIIRRTFWTSTAVRRCVGDDFGGSPFIQLDCDEICTIRQDNYYCKDSSKALDFTTGERKMSYTVSSRLLGWYATNLPIITILFIHVIIVHSCGCS